MGVKESGTKEKLLALFEENKGTYFSGEEIAERLSVSRIAHPADRLQEGQEIFAAVLALDLQQGRVVLTHRELLGTWAENAALFRAGMTVPGYIRGIKDYGAFVELTPNLSGLAESREGLREGDRVSVYVKSILPDRMKLKLLIIDQLPPGRTPIATYVVREDKRQRMYGFVRRQVAGGRLDLEESIFIVNHCQSILSLDVK